MLICGGRFGSRVMPHFSISSFRGVRITAMSCVGAMLYRGGKGSGTATSNHSATSSG
jgi:hypothetical protein